MSTNTQRLGQIVIGKEGKDLNNCLVTGKRFALPRRSALLAGFALPASKITTKEG